MKHLLRGARLEGLFMARESRASSRYVLVLGHCEPMRIVLVLIEPPLPFGNAIARHFYVVLRGLVERGHTVTTFAACTATGDIEKARELFPAPRFDLRCFPTRTERGLMAKWRTLREPYSYVFSQELRQDLDRQLARGFDVLHLEPHWAGWLGVAHSKRTLLACDYLYRIDLPEVPYFRLRDWARYRLTLGAEARILRRFPYVTTLTPRLSASVRHLAPSARVDTVPLGLDASLYPFDVDRKTTSTPVVGLIGSFNWQPTYTAGVRLLTRLWPEIKQRVPEARLHIVGRSAKRALGRYATSVDVSIIEDVPDTIPYFKSLDLMLYAPERGSGMKVKVIEALALGVPVVTNADGIEGLPAEDRVHAAIAEDDAGLIERTVALLRNPDARARLRVAGRELVERHCGPSSVLDALESVYTRIREHA